MNLKQIIRNQKLQNFNLGYIINEADDDVEKKDAFAGKTKAGSDTYWYVNKQGKMKAVVNPPSEGGWELANKEQAEEAEEIRKDVKVDIDKKTRDNINKEMESKDLKPHPEDENSFVDKEGNEIFQIGADGEVIPGGDIDQIKAREGEPYAEYIDDLNKRLYGDESEEPGPDDEEGDDEKIDEPTDTKPRPRRAANITQESIDAIDGPAKEGGMEGTVLAPGNVGSKINEIAVGNAMVIFSENPDASVEDVVEQLMVEMGDTPEGLKNGEEKNRKTLMAAAISAKRENVRVQEFMASEDLDPDQTTISHVWGSQESLENTVKFLEDAGVEEVNGIPLKDADPPPSYEEIILAGGAGENPTDTMITMIDSSKSPPKAIILHTSNKMATSDIQSNSSPENNIRGMITQADKLLASGDLTTAEHKQITQEANETIEKISKLQGEVESKINDSFNNLKEEAEDGTLAQKMEDESEGKWGQIMNRYTKTGGPGAPPEEFRVQVSDPMTKADKNKIADAYVREMEYLATAEEEVTPPAKWMTAMMARVGMSDDDKEELNELYRQQHDVTNEMRVNMNETKEGFGDRVMSETFMSRLHLNVAEGHAPGGIPPQNFELNMGINNSNIKYDENGQPYMKEGNKFYPVDIETGQVDTSAEPVKISKLSSGTTATVGNMDTIAAALGYKIPPTPENIAEKIRVGPVESATVGPSGKAFIYGINVAGEEVIIGVQTTRPKDGVGTKAQDTIEWAKDFQTRLQLASARQAQQESEERPNESIRFLGNILSEMKQNSLRHHWAKAEEDYPAHYFIREINEGSLI